MWESILVTITQKQNQTLKTHQLKSKKFPPLKYNASIFHDLNIVKCRLSLKSRELTKLRPIGCESWT